jgi:hypothetical protein
LCEVDARGAFQSRALLPGRYAVKVVSMDATTYSDARDTNERTPLLSELKGTSGAGQEVAVHPGVTTEVALAAPRFGRIEGVVLAGGLPLAGVRVFASSEEGPSGLFWRGPDDEEAHKGCPNTITDAAGRFAFLVASRGRWSLRARHPRGLVATSPVVIAIEDPGGVAQVQIVLPMGVVRARFDPTTISVRDRRSFVAYLFPSAKADGDPLYWAEYRSAQTSGMRVEPIGTRGELCFEFVPEGRWVLRLVRRLDEIVLQRILAVAGGEVVDLGELRAPPTVSTSLGCGLDASHGVWLRIPDGGNANGIFVRTIAVKDSKIELSCVAPGRYVLQAFRIERSWGYAIGITGDPVGSPVTIDVHADGHVVPATVFTR